MSDLVASPVSSRPTSLAVSRASRVQPLVSTLREEGRDGIGKKILKK